MGSKENEEIETNWELLQSLDCVNSGFHLDLKYVKDIDRNLTMYCMRMVEKELV